MKNILFTCCGWKHPGIIRFIDLYAKDQDQAREFAVEYFREREYTNYKPKEITVSKVDMNNRKPDIANQKEWDRDADEEAWAAETQSAGVGWCQGSELRASESPPRSCGCLPNLLRGAIVRRGRLGCNA